jgi:DHA3 family macrolide efflux protein-like MFS transporter
MAVPDQIRPQVNATWAAPFFTIWSGQALSQLGSRMAAFALIWWMTQTTGSATVLATGTLLGYLPYVVLGPFAGALIDRWNRRIVMIVADTVIALTTAILAYLFWTGSIQVWHVYVVTLIGSLAGTFQGMAMFTSTSLLVPERHMSRVQGANQTLNGILSIGAPPLGALLLALLPMHAILGLDIATAAFAIAPLFFIPIPQPPRTGTDGPVTGTSLWADVKSGFLYIWRWPGLRYILMIGSSMNFFGNASFALMPLLISEHFGLGAIYLGWFEAAFGSGIILGGLILIAWGGFRRRILTTLVGWSLFVPGMLLIGFAPGDGYWLAWVGMLIGGIGSSVNNGAFNTLILACVKPEMQGRVGSVIGSVAQVTTMVGLMVAGPLTDWLGDARFWSVAGGIYYVIVVPVAFLTPTILHLEEERPGAERA